MFKKFLRLFKTPKNEVHPEMAEGEVFLTNVGQDREFGWPGEDDYSHIGWGSKRKGQTAYDIDGNPIKFMNPVFVKRDELLAKGIDPDNLFDRKKRKNTLFWIGCVIALITGLISFALYLLFGVDAGLWVVPPFAIAIWLVIKGAF